MMELSLSAMFSLVLSVGGASHPLIFCLALIFFTIALGFVMGITLSKWVMYAIILIFLGGMMVIFIYMTTLTSNEKMLFPSPTFFLAFTGLLLLQSLTSLCYSLSYSTLALAQHPFTSPSSPVILFLVAYLLLTLFIVVAMAKSFKGALVKFS